MSRSIDEWVGSTPDAKIPARVRLRVFEAHRGICALTGRKIMPGDEWDLDHRVPLVLGGEHRESNLQPVLRAAHREKTRADVGAKAKADRIRKKHLGLWPKPAGNARLKSKPFPPGRNRQGAQP